MLALKNGTLPPAAIYIHNNTGTREWISYGFFGHYVALGGLYQFNGSDRLNNLYFHVATCYLYGTS